MKPIEKDEVYEHLRGFLRSKGIELQEGSYSQTIQKSCSILADAINLSQRGIEKAKTGIDQQLDKMRQVIHEKTAPKPQNAAASKSTTASASAPTPSSSKRAADSPSTSKPKRTKPVAKKGTPRRGKR
jgi:hypothetical protein